MKKHLGMSLSIGIVAASWFFVASALGLQPWPAFIGWSIFFWEGADWGAVKKGFPAVVLGAVLGYITLEGILLALGGSAIVIAIIAACMVGLLAFTMAIAQTFPIFGAASATFIGASHYFALTGYLDKTPAFLHAAFITSMGLILGMISMAVGAALNKVILKDEQ